MTASAPLLEVHDLSVSYRRRRRLTRAVDRVSLDVAVGEAVGLVGESGSGKSTLARAILGLVPVEGGSIRVLGKDATHLSFKRRRALYRDVQIVFQDPYSSLNPSLTIGETLAEPLRAFGERDGATIRERIAAMLQRVQLAPEAAGRHPDSFSGGQRQRIAIARALMLSPKLLVCDEAVSALDLSVQAQILNLLRELKADAGLSYLFISHDVDVVRHLCDRVVVLYRGAVMESGPAAIVTGTPAHPYTNALLQAAPALDPREQRERRLRRARAATATASVRSGDGETRGGCPFAPRCPHARDRCRSERPALRPVEGEALAACHRYPQWRAEAAAHLADDPRRELDLEREPSP